MVVPPININIRKHTKSAAVMQAGFDLPNYGFRLLAGYFLQFQHFGHGRSDGFGRWIAQLLNCCDLTTISDTFKVGITFIQL